MNQLIRGILLLCLVWIPIAGQTTAAVVVGDPKPLTPDGSLFMAPIWSPDSRELAVTRAGYQGLYLIGIDGNGEPVRYGDETVTALGAQFSSTGNRLLVYLARYENYRRHGAIGVIDLLNGDLLALTPFDTKPTGEATWLNGDGEVHILKGGAAQRVAIPGVALKKETDSTDSETLYYLDRGQIARLSVGSGQVARIETVPGRKLNLKISPDGKKMVFEIVGGHLWVTSIDGSDPVDLGLGYRPCWAPDGVRLAFMATTDDGHQYLTADIIAVNADGTGRVSITATADRLEMNPAWSPDGKYIAYDAMDTGRVYLQAVQ